MSRSFGARSFTTWSPMYSSPSVMSSSPAIIRSAVDFPQPDGPTRITNSPSAISRSMCFTASKPSGYRLVTSRNWILATGPSLSLYRARRQAGHDPALEDEHHDDDRDRHDHRRGGDLPRRVRELRSAREERERGRHRAGRVGRGQDVREQEVVPREDEHEDRRGEHARGRERRDHLGERLERRGSVDLRGLLELPRDLAEERRQ